MTIKECFRLDRAPVYLALASLLWLFLLRRFITVEVCQTEDAVAYFEHFKYYFYNLIRGDFPLWDPMRNFGVPNELFLRRIGSFNPLFAMILVFDAMGMSFYHAYILFHSFYYLFGMTGFYLLARQIFKDQRPAFLAVLLLLFSSLGTRFLDSYILLTFIPMVWFFYFLVVFCERPARGRLLGMVFSLMVILTTYIIFYFMNILGFFVLCFSIFYFKELKEIVRRVYLFILENKLFVGICVGLLLLSCVPGLLLYLDADQGEFALPKRHYASTNENVMVVAVKTITKWGILHELVFASFFGFGNLPRMQFAILYIPVVVYLLFLMGTLATRINRKIGFFVVWGLGQYLIYSPYATGLYQFLYDHVPYFKLFRNLHFFLWMILLPIFILLTMEQIRPWISWRPNTRRQKAGLVAFLILVHGVFAGFLYAFKTVSVTTYGTVVLSFGFLCLYFLGGWQKRFLPVMLSLIALTWIQPLEVYRYIAKNAEQYIPSYIQYSPYPRLTYMSENRPPGRVQWASDGSVKDRAPMTQVYLTTPGHQFLMENLDDRIFQYYRYAKFIVYDRVEQIDPKAVDRDRLERAFYHNLNVAYIFSEDNVPLPEGTEARPGRHPLKVEGPSRLFRVLKYEVNSIRLHTNFSRTKFLVYNDNYHPEWRATLNGRPLNILRANVAFKGVWLPPGENVVEFHYGAWWRHAFNWLMLGIFYAVFAWLVRLLIRERKEAHS